jgi:small subunit ribosomal protein S8
MANHRIVEIPASNLKKRMTEILYGQGYILKYKFEDDSKQGVIKIALKYDPTTKEPAIKSLERISRPGLRTYSSPAEFKRVKNGLGVAIISTSKGVMTDKEAKVQNVGGEVLCYIY